MRCPLAAAGRAGARLWARAHLLSHRAAPGLRARLPGLGNQWLVLLKDTALVSLIGVNEMMRQAQMASASTW